MKIKNIRIKNVLSYKEQEIDFEDNLNIFVGPNGVGKSNLLNLIIYILKKTCFPNYTIEKLNYGSQSRIEKYSIHEVTPFFNSDESIFLRKHKNLQNEPSEIVFTLKFEEGDVRNLEELLKHKEEVIDFCRQKADNNAPYRIDRNETSGGYESFFMLNNSSIKAGEEVQVNIKENNGLWEPSLDDGHESYYIFMRYFSFVYEILNHLKINHKVVNPFIFFEAYRNNNQQSTIAGISDYNSSSIYNNSSISNMSSIANSIGSYSTYITMVTKKFGELQREYIERKDENGKMLFEKDEAYVKLKDFFGKFGYEIDLKCIDFKNNVYQLYIKHGDVQIELDAISSGEREIINFACGLFMEQMRDGIIIIDEPELHLHPNWQKKLIQMLKDETREQNIQIMFVTHSASFINYNILNNIYRISQKNGFSECIKVAGLAENSESFRKNLSVINATNNEKIFFAKYAMLVEGITDEILFKRIYAKEIAKGIPDGLEFVRIEGKNNLNNFRHILDSLDIPSFYIGDYDNLYDREELAKFFITDIKAQEKDLKQKNKSYALLDLLVSINNHLEVNSEETFKELKVNYDLYNERFLKKKPELTDKEQNEIKKYIVNEYENNNYFLMKGEIEDYLGAGKSKSNKARCFELVIDINNNDTKYEEFKSRDGFHELKAIIEDIANKICVFDNMPEGSE